MTLTFDQYLLEELIVDTMLAEGVSYEDAEQIALHDLFGEADD